MKSNKDLLLVGKEGAVLQASKNIYPHPSNPEARKYGCFCIKVICSKSTLELLKEHLSTKGGQVNLAYGYLTDYHITEALQNGAMELVAEWDRNAPRNDNELWEDVDCLKQLITELRSNPKIDSNREELHLET